jgi:trans-2,3-dihydro-3-hydroxyanthranilate isomerase
MARRVAFLDVFAERPLAGNGLAVVDDADGVSEEVMLGFARETRLSETTFVQTAGEEGADYRNRIWTPREELPFAGHPSRGTAVAVARWRELSEASFVQETGAGLQPIEVRDEGSRWHASMLQAEAEHGPELERGAAMAAVGLEPDDADPELPPRIVSTGLPQLITPVADESALARARPDYEAIEALLSSHGCDSLYLCRCDPERAVAKSRCFVGGIGEDPATGSAAGPLCSYLAGLTGTKRLTIRQGEQMGRPSVLEAEIADGRPRVGGAVFPLIEGNVELPAG